MLKYDEVNIARLKRTSINRYREYIGNEAVDRILQKAEFLKGLNLIHVNSTYSGGGVAEILRSLVLLMNGVGVKTEWHLIFGSEDFFSVTKKFHNALQGHDVNLSDLKKEIYEETIHENSIRMKMDADFIVVHDPQPLFLIHHFRKRCPWIWRCHLDLKQPNSQLWKYLLPTIESYDAAIFTQKQSTVKIPTRYFHPAIDPFSSKNIQISSSDIDARLAHYHIPTDLPIVVQISRFDRWKDPIGVIEAYKLARKEVGCTLVLVGDMATDDPEGQQVYESLLSQKDERIIILAVKDTFLVNALQRKAHVVLQKSIREGFGLTVTEAMWKGAAVIGSNVGGIPLQIKDGVNGFLVDTIAECAQRIVQVIKDNGLRVRVGKAAHETIKENFLMCNLLENYLNLLGEFEPSYKLKSGGKNAFFRFFGLDK